MSLRFPVGCVIRGACHWTPPEDIRELSDHSNLRHGSCAVLAVYAVRRAMRAQRSNRRRAPLLSVRSCSHPLAEAMRRTSCPSMGVTTARPPAVTRSFALPGVDPSTLLVLPPLQRARIRFDLSLGGTNHGQYAGHSRHWDGFGTTSAMWQIADVSGIGPHQEVLRT